MPRAIWKGTLAIEELTCGVALYTAASTSERIAFHTLNRKTGHRVHRQYVDEETGRLVPPEDQVKGFDRGGGDYILLDPEDVASVVPESDKVLSVETFVPCKEVDDLFFDRPYYVAPSSPAAAEAFAVIRDGLARNKVAALARTVIFRRMRSILIRPHEEGLVATTLAFDYEVRPPQEAFEAIPKLRLDKEMLDLAQHIIRTKAGAFDPAGFDDRYEAALAEMVKAKIEGRKLRKPKPVAATKPTDLMEALRRSVQGEAGEGTKAKPRGRSTGRRKAKAA